MPRPGRVLQAFSATLPRCPIQIPEQSPNQREDLARHFDPVCPLRNALAGRLSRGAKNASLFHRQMKRENSAVIGARNRLGFGPLFTKPRSAVELGPKIALATLAILASLLASISRLSKRPKSRAQGCFKSLRKAQKQAR